MEVDPNVVGGGLGSMVDVNMMWRKIVSVLLGQK